MGEIFKHLFELIFVRTKSLISKFFYLLLVVLVLFVVNDYFGLTKNIFINRKISQLQKLKELDSTVFYNDSAIKAEIQIIKKGILNKKNTIDKIREGIKNISIRQYFTWHYKSNDH